MPDELKKLPQRDIRDFADEYFNKNKPDWSKNVKPVDLPPLQPLDAKLTHGEVVWYKWLPKVVKVAKVLTSGTIAKKVIDILELLHLTGGTMPDEPTTTGIKSSPKTTILGIAALLSVAGSVLTSLFDGDPTTNIDYATTIPAIIGAIGLIFGKFGKS